MSVPAPYDARLAKLRKAMRDVDADVFLCDHAELLHWLTGYTISETFYRAVVVPLREDPVWILRAIDEGPCRAATWVKDVVTFADHDDPHTAVAGVIQRFAPKVVAVDFDSIGFTAATHAKLRSRLPDTNLLDCSGISGTIRAVKDAAEIALIAKAASIADGAMAEIAVNLAAGVRPRDASAIAAAYYLKNGGDDWWVGPISISRRANEAPQDMAFLHATLADDTLAHGDILHVELVPRVQNYSARMMRSICVGEPSKDMRATLVRLAELQDAQFRSMVPGSDAKTVDEILRRAVLAEGLRERFENITGYQLGLYAKTPRSSDTSLAFHPGAGFVLEQGMVFHMYVTAKGLALSETVVVEASGARRLTQTARSILTC